jgi:hypothetical protein
MARKPPPRTPKPPIGRTSTAPTRRTSTTPAAQHDGKSIRVRLLGCRTLEEIRAMLDEAIYRLEELKIPKARSIYLYLTPADADGEPLITRAKIADLVIEKPPPYRSAADEYKAP